MSQVSCEAISAALARHFVEVRASVVNNLADLEALVARSPDLVFLGMEFVPDDPAKGIADPNKTWLSDYFDEREIAYTGSSHAAHELERDKPLAKQRILDAGLRTSAFCVVKQDQPLGREDISLQFPLFVKPTNRGGGLGIDSDSVVHNFEQLRQKVQAIATRLQADSLVEEYLPGREFSVAILKDEFLPEFSVMPIELIAPLDSKGERLLSRRVKSQDAEQAIEITDEYVKHQVVELAMDVFRALGARDYGRIDIRLDMHGTPHFLEANLIPSLIRGYGSFPKACVLNIGLEHGPMIMRIARLGLARSVNDTEDALEPLTMNAPVFSTPELAFE